MLASIIGLYVISGANGGHTFDIGQLSEMHKFMSPTTQNLLSLASLFELPLRHLSGHYTPGFPMQPHLPHLEPQFFSLAFSTRWEHLE